MGFYTLIQYDNRATLFLFDEIQVLETSDKCTIRTIDRFISKQRNTL